MIRIVKSLDFWPVMALVGTAFILPALAWLLLKLFKRQPVASTRRAWFETAKGGHGPVKPDD